jgi:muramoyltetrapeptide carboxypeptidase
MVPAFLSKGDTVAVVATAKVFDHQEVRNGIEVLRSWGLIVKEGEFLYEQDHYYAGSDAQRLSDLQKMFDDSTVKAIVFARGGYGTSRILDKVNFTRFSKKPKWLIGFSDLTILHSEVQKRGIASIHGNMCLQLAKPEFATSVQALKETLAGKMSALTGPYHSKNRKGKAKGIVVGGNLTLLIHALGTSSDFDWKGKILFLEEIGESLYHLDRMMLQLKRCGKLKNLAGLVLGQFSDMKDTTPPFGKKVEEIIFEHVASYKYPVAFGFACGHEAPNFPLVLGGRYSLSVEEESVLKYIG